MNSLKEGIKVSKKFINIYVGRFSSTKPHHNEHSKVEENIKPKLLRVAIVGMPNAGKSALINSLMDRRVCPVSSKVHTTKKKSVAIFTEDDTQVVFLDTPGIVSYDELRRFKLNKSFIRDGSNSLYQADVIGLVHDASNVWTRERIDIKLLHALEPHKKRPSFLILNKVDLIKQKRKLLELARKLTENRLEGRLSLENIEVDGDEMDVIRGWPYFKEIFMVSALTGDGIDSLRNYLLQRAKPAPWMFPADQFAKDKNEDLIVNTIRAKLLDSLPQEVPYKLEHKIELYEQDESGKITTVVIVTCPTQRIARLIAGSSDGRINQITTGCQDDLQNIFRNFVRLKIVLEVKNNADK